MAAYQCLRDDNADDWVINLQISAIAALTKAQLFDNDAWADYKLVKGTNLKYNFIEANGSSQITVALSEDQTTAKAIYTAKGIVARNIKFTCKRSDLGVQY